jgi:glycosyltransferase involved in cell wall biosynthesis
VHVGILIGHFPPGAFGGAELQAEGWAARLAARHRVSVITRRDPATQPERELRDGFEVHRLPVSSVPLWRTAADLGAIARSVRALRPDVLLCFQTFVSGWAGVRAGAPLGVPVLTWIRGEDEYRLDRPLHRRWLHPRVWERSAAVLVQSPQNRVDLLRAIGRWAPSRAARIQSRLHVVPNGLDLPAGSGAPGGRVLSVGRLIREKGMDLVIDAAARGGLPLTIAGEGPERAALEARALASGGDVRFEGHVPRHRLATLYGEARMVVLAARTGEGLPNVLLEAMAHQRPVIATPCAGTRDLLVDGVNGLLVPPGDAGALAAAMTRLAGDTALAGRCAERARETVERYGWDAVQPALESVLERCARDVAGR